MKELIKDEESRVYIFNCPKCDNLIEVEFNQLNCREFVHGYFYNKVNDSIILTHQVNPHASLEECKRLLDNNAIVGCGKPFKIIDNQGKLYAI